MSPGFPVHPQMLPLVVQAFDRKSMKPSIHEVTYVASNICGYNIDLKFFPHILFLSCC